MKKMFFRPFLIFLVLFSLVGLFLLFRPFIVELIIATIMVSVFYRFYEKMTKVFWNKKYLASFITCIILLFIVLIPISGLMVIASKKASLAYSGIESFLANSDSLRFSVLEKMGVANDSYGDIFTSFVGDVVKNINDWLVSGATLILKGTSKFLFSLALIVFTMFFFFVEGKEMARKLILWSPLPNKYDLKILNKFRCVSRSILITIFVSTIIQGLVGAFAFLIIGWPFIFVFIIMALLSLIPYIGSAIFYLPASIYLMFSGQFWQGVFILAWGALVLNNINKYIQTHLLKNQVELNPIFIIFSILGGISIFGFWGIIIGPMIIALSVVVFHIYELEYDKYLEK